MCTLPFASSCLEHRRFRMVKTPDTQLFRARIMCLALSVSAGRFASVEYSNNNSNNNVASRRMSCSLPVLCSWVRIVVFIFVSLHACDMLAFK